MVQIPKLKREDSFGLAWLCLSLACTLHIWDEAAHQFLPYYNATVLALYAHFGGFPRLDMEFRTWLGGLLLGNLALLALTPLAFRNARWLRPVGYFIAVVAFLECLGQVLLTIRGHTSDSVQFEGVSPGFYTAPLLLISSAYLLWSLRKSARDRQRLSKG
jgi:hypothetical protein